MKCGLRFLVCSAVTALVGLVFCWRCIADLESQYGAIVYLETSVRHMLLEHSEPRVPFIGANPGDMVIVMAKLETDNTDWVAEELPDWHRALYIVNPTSSTRSTSLTTPVNKGHESMAYLTYIIDNYYQLPSTIAFLHSHRSGFLQAWHVDSPLHDNVAAMQALQLDHVQRNGYVNLRCNWNPGCMKSHLDNKHVTPDVFQQVFENTSTPPFNETSAAAGISTRDDKQKQLVIPSQVGAACCAQFAVSRTQVLQRPLDDYIQFRQWVLDTEKNDARSGRVMEFLWHVIFGKEAVYCPDEEVCYCEVYGRC